MKSAGTKSRTPPISVSLTELAIALWKLSSSQQHPEVPQPRRRHRPAVSLPVGETVVDGQRQRHEHDQHIEDKLRRNERQDQSPPRPLEHRMSLRVEESRQSRSRGDSLRKHAGPFRPRLLRGTTNVGYFSTARLLDSSTSVSPAGLLQLAVLVEARRRSAATISSGPILLQEERLHRLVPGRRERGVPVDAVVVDDHVGGAPTARPSRPSRSSPLAAPPPSPTGSSAASRLARWRARARSSASGTRRPAGR